MSSREVLGSSTQLTKKTRIGQHGGSSKFGEEKLSIRRAMVNLKDELRKANVTLPPHWEGMSAEQINRAIAKWAGDSSIAELTDEQSDRITEATARVLFAEGVNEAVERYMEGTITPGDYVEQVGYLEEFFVEDLKMWPTEEV
jgi:hypothetical protein